MDIEKYVSKKMLRNQFFYENKSKVNFQMKKPFDSFYDGIVNRVNPRNNPNLVF